MSGRGAAGLSLLAWALGCATADSQFGQAKAAFSRGEWQRATAAFKEFVHDRCPAWDPDPRCKEACLTAAEAMLRMDAPRLAYNAVEDAMRFEPAQGPPDPRLLRLAQEAHRAFAAKLAVADGEGTITVKFESKTTERFRFLSVKFRLDLLPLPTTGETYVPGTVAHPVPSTKVHAGEHELELIALLASGPRLPPGYKFRVVAQHRFKVAAGAALDIGVRVIEDPERPATDALDATFDVRTSSSP